MTDAFDEGYEAGHAAAIKLVKENHEYDKQQNKQFAIHAAAMYWSGMTIMRGKREDCSQLIETANKIKEWLDDDSV